ncbi:MAG: EAL domain-containing protein [Deltaproteobacteria bacterium]|nr:EAL domain-containing protein [Deltaproteobacteria bacterium]
MSSNLPLGKKVRKKGRPPAREHILFRDIKQIAKLGDFDWDITTNKIFCSEEVYQIFGIPVKTVGVPLEDFLSSIHRDDLPMMLDTLHATFSGQNELRLKCRIYTPLGLTKKVIIRGKNLPVSPGGSSRLLGTVQDITEQSRMEEKLMISTKMFLNSNDAIMLTGADSTILDVNPAFSQITGFSKSEAIGKKPSLLKSGHHDDYFYKQMWTNLNKNGQWEGEIWDRRKNGEIYPKWLTIHVVKNLKNEPRNYIAMFSDRSSEKMAEQNLRKLSHFDMLTGLPNFNLFRELFEQSILHSNRKKTLLAVLFLDLDNFKAVNETLGHTAGDELLAAAARRIKECLREGDPVCRLGGDDFHILMTELSNVNHPAELAGKLQEAFAKPFELAGREIFSTISTGIAVFPQDGEDAEQLFKQAGNALQQAKKNGGSQYRFANHAMLAKAQERLNLKNSLRHAMEHNELFLHFQPKLALKTNHITSLEVLLRWNKPDEGMIPPDRFIPLAEESGLIIPLGEWILWEACKQMKAWEISGMPPMRAAVNLSGKQLSGVDVPKLVEGVLSRTGLAPRHLELELTESSLMENADHSIHMLNALREMGVELSIDDFGTGYSSLSYLKKFPINSLKIDKSFVNDITTNSDDAAIASTIIAMGHTLNLNIIAEGVETREQLVFLNREGCDYIQGYVISRPVSALEYAEFIKARHPSPTPLK